MALVFEKYGMTNAGFIAPSSAEVLWEDYRPYITTHMPNIDLTDGSQYKLIFDSVNNIVFNILQQAQTVYFNKDPRYATGWHQDGMYAISDVKRITATSSTISLVCTGANGIVVPQGAQVSNPESGDVFISKNEFTINALSCVEAIFGFKDFAISTVYGVFINGVVCGLTSTDTDTAETTLDKIVSAINLQSQDINCAAVRDGQTIIVSSSDATKSFSITVSTNIYFSKISSVAEYEALETGPIIVNPNTVTKILTLVSGLYSVNNPLEGQIGRNIETDQEFRERYFKIGIYNRATSTYWAIVNNFNDPEQIAGVSYANLQVNDTETTDIYGLPPRSIHLIIEGGDEQDIGKLLLSSKAGGIATYGNTSVQVEDAKGNLRTMKFSRPVKKYVWLQCTVTLDQETTPPTNYLDEILRLVLEYAAKIKIGDNVNLKVAASFPLSNIAGLADLVILGAVTSDPTQAPIGYSTSNIAMSEAEVAIFSSERISII